MSALFAVRTIIGCFEKETGKDFYEWRRILLEKNHNNDRAAARAYIIEKGLSEGYANFLIWTSSEHLKYQSREK